MYILAQNPKTHLPGGEDVLPIPGESHRADRGPVVGLEEGGHTPVGHSVPDLDAAVFGAADEVFSGVVPPETGDIPCVLVRGHGADEALGCVHVVEADHGACGPSN